MKTKSYNALLRQFKCRNSVFCLLILLSLLSCKTANTGNVNDFYSPENETQVNRQNADIVFKNNTSLIVKIVRGTGTVDEGTIYPGQSLSVSYIHNSGTVFYPRFYLPLTKSYIYPPLDERGLYPSERIFYRVDGSQKEQEIVITNPIGIIDDSTFIVFTNESNRGGLTLESPSGVFHCLFPSSDKRIINVQETVVYSINPRNNNLFISPVNKQLEKIQYHNGYVYYFTFDGTFVTLTDSRPLHRVGESGKPEILPVTAKSASTPLLAADGMIQLFAPVDNGVMRYAYDSGMNKKAEIRNGDNFQVVSAIQTGSGYFISGYEKEGNKFSPIARIHNADGTMRSLLLPSTPPEYYSAFFKAAARKDDTWLVAGGAKTHDKNSFAYVRLVRDTGSALDYSWKLGKKEFDDFLKIPDRCGEIRCAAYDSVRNRWLLSGENREYDSELKNRIIGSYLAVIDNDGKIQSIDTSFKGMQFYKILLDKEGNYYLVGEEQKGRDTLALIIKYNSDGIKLGQNSAAPLSHSYYQDAILDIENDQIVLGGTMQADDEYGNKGVPFIEALSPDTLELLWQAPLKHDDLGEARLVTAIVPAPDYGFALALSGIDDDGYRDQPYIIARVNARGKLP